MIPENVRIDYELDLATKILEKLNDDKNSGQALMWKSELPSVQIGLDVAKKFVKKGYYAKANWFVESWKGLQCIIVSKRPLNPSNARMVYSEML